MSRLRVHLIRIVLVAVIATSAAVNTASGQVFDYRMNMADSLYGKKQYTQSLSIYKEIFSQNAYSPAMLLKMAYIEEGLGRPSMALYYINLYYEATHETSALTKMTDMARKYDFTGYTYTNFDRNIDLIRQNRQPITMALAGISALFMILVAVSVQRKRRPYASLTFLIFFTLSLVSFTNVNLERHLAITSRAPAYLMSGPSSGSNVIGIITDGHRLAIAGKHDVWVKVIWRDGFAYLKESQLLEVKL